jgi:Uma2 family endonuclease
MAPTLRWNSKDLESLPDDGKRYEIIDGELYVSKQPHYCHQLVCINLGSLLRSWSLESKLGQANFAPGLIFADDDDVAPDIVWASFPRLKTLLQADGRLHAAPELVIEVLSPGPRNETRDREAKLKLYSRRGVSEYWIVNWMARQIEVYRREDAELHLALTLFEADTLTTPLLPGFSCRLADLFEGIPTQIG